MLLNINSEHRRLPWPRAIGSASTAPLRTPRSWLPTTSWLARGSRVVAHDAGIAERTILIEFDSFEQAVAARASAAYQEALAALADGVERDFRIIEGLD